MKCIWKRKEILTKGADPTVVVIWSCEELGISITEFQNVYSAARYPQSHDLDIALCEELHKALEGKYQTREEYKEFMSDTGLEPGE